MLTKDSALLRLKSARDAFWFSLGAYALLTNEPSRSELSKFAIQLDEFNNIAANRGEPSPNRGNSYTIGFNAALDAASAKRIVEYSFRQMIIESFETAKEFEAKNTLSLSSEPWYEFARHYRNGLAHNGRWSFRSAKGLPLTWRNRTIDANLQGMSLDGFLTWFEGLQLCAQMNISISTMGKNQTPL